jgi:hypothetical protein
MSGFEPIPALAGGQIRPSRFVKPSTAADNTLLEADANEMAVGISSEATRDAPIDGASGDAATTGDGNMMYYTEGMVALLEIGSGGVTHGAQVKSDTDGKGVLAATTGATMQWCSAIALESALEGESARVLIKVFPIYPALS